MRLLALLALFALAGCDDIDKPPPEDMTLVVEDGGTTD
jgi:hypothetical protein